MKKFTEFLEEEFNSVFDSFAEELENNLQELVEGDIPPVPKKQVQPKQPWADFEHDKDHEYSKDEFKKHFNKEVKPKIDKIKKPFHQILHNSKVGNAKVLAATKSLDSLHDKVVKRNKPLSDVHDIVRGAVLTKNKEEADKVVNNIKKNAVVLKHEYKEHGNKDDSTGYGGVHHLVLDVNGVKTETQVMPKKIWDIQQHAHHIYQKYRSMKNPQLHPEYEADMKKSKAMFGNVNKKVDVKEKQ
jgi:ppGpp synthetase/RelA/SpoT-type nucleotidyltranferase